MKTNVNMIRPLGNYKIIQRTKDGYFAANDLLSQWNKKNKRRRLDDFLKSSKTIEFTEVLNEEIAQGENSPLAYYVIKGRNTPKGKTKDQVWMHPYLFIDFAMWINPRFKLKVIKFVYDQLIQLRHSAGDNYKLLSSSISKFNNCNYREVATAIQWIVFNKKGKNLRQTATQKQLSEIADIEKQMAFAIDMGYITTYPQLIRELQKMWNRKYQPHKFQISA